MSKRPTRRERRTAEIVDVATEMIVEGGIASFGVNKLAAELDLTPGALYRYFDSRDEILIAVELGILDYFGRFFDAVETEFGDTSGLRRVVTLVRAYAALETLRPERFKLLSRFVSGPDPVVKDEAAAKVVGPTIALLSRFAAALQSAMTEGALRDERALQRAALTWSCVQGVLDRRKLGRFSEGLFDPEPLIDELMETLLVGWGADADEVREALSLSPSRDDWNALLEEIDV